jgi:hypothetical protein
MTPEQALARVYARSDRMVGRRVADEYILVPIVGRGANLDSIFNLSRVAAFIWESIDGRRDGHAIIEAVIARFEVDRRQAEDDYCHFLKQLLAIEAVLPAPRPGE